MASGDSVVQVQRISAPPTDFASIDTAQSASTPVEIVYIWDFDASTVEYLDFVCRLGGYGGGGLMISIYWSATTASSGNVVWEVGIRRLEQNVTDFDAAHVFAYQSVTTPAPGTVGAQARSDIVLTDGAQMDNWQDGEMGIVRVRRSATNGSDTMVNDAELWALVGQET